jgi:hypothetical protein
MTESPSNPVRFIVSPVGFGQSAELWLVVGVLAFSRFSGRWMVPSRQAHDVLGGHLEVLRQFGAVPARRTSLESCSNPLVAVTRRGL